MGSSKNIIQLIKNKTKKYLPKKFKGFIKDQLRVFRSKESNTKDSGKKFNNHIEVDGIVCKRLTSVEADKKKSNQHEFNGSNFLKEATKPKLDFYEISKDVNKPNNNDISLIQKV